MDSKKIYSELKAKGYDVELISMFSYDIDKNRRFHIVNVNGKIGKEIISLVGSYGCILVADTYVSVEGNTPSYIVRHAVYPKDMASFDWEESCE